MPLKLSRYNLANLNSFIAAQGGHLSNEDIEIGSDIKIHHETLVHKQKCEQSFPKQYLILKMALSRILNTNRQNNKVLQSLDHKNRHQNLPQNLVSNRLNN